MNPEQTPSATADQNVRQLPWSADLPPLMLAPLQGLTNRAMRALFVDWVRPDVVFTEFMRVSNGSRRHLAPRDQKEAASTAGDVPLVAQLVGNKGTSLVAAARSAEELGVRHINLNMGCPYGRMTSGATGGGMMKDPAPLEEIIPALRQAIAGSFSIKVRAGYDNPEQIFSLLPLFEKSGVDFLILHPRTVVQKYTGAADHSITRRVVSETQLPVIANGDIRTAAGGLQLLAESGAAGLMLGRGAIADPLLFKRLRELDTTEPTRSEVATMLRHYLSDLHTRYSQLFCGEQQILAKMKNAIVYIDDPAFSDQTTKMKRSRSLAEMTGLIETLS